MNFEEIVQKAVNAKAKAGLRSSIMVWDPDICCPKSHCSFNITASKVQTQKITAKDSHPKELKIKEARLTLSWAEVSKPFEQACKEKKKKKYQERQDKEQTLASTANTIEVQQKKKKKNRDQDVSKITYFNCNKKGHYASICTKLPKN